MGGPSGDPDKHSYSDKAVADGGTGRGRAYIRGAQSILNPLPPHATAPLPHEPSAYNPLRPVDGQNIAYIGIYYIYVHHSMLSALYVYTSFTLLHYVYLIYIYAYYIYIYR